MNPGLFLADFGHIANAPEGVNRLREMIYNLAVTGALSEQRRDEGDGHLLLNEITATKQALIDTGAFKRSPKLENLRDGFKENLPKIPSSWAWSRLVEVGEISPKNEAEDDVMASFVSMSAISEMHSSVVASENRSWGNIKKGYTHFADGDVVLAKITPCFENGKAAVMANLTNGMGAGTTELHVVRPIVGVIEPGYIYVFLRSPYFKIVGEGHMTGTAGQKRLPTEYFATRPFPLPPLAEQKRIVAKVDELMALCDQLEAQQQERERRFPVLSRTCHARFAEAPTPANLNRIFDETGSVSTDDLRTTILTLAVQGKLLPQDLDDESVGALLSRVRSTKARLQSEGKIGKEKPSKEVQPPALPFVVPKTWRWVKLLELTELITKGSSPKWQGINYVPGSGGVLFITSENVGNYRLRKLDELKYVESQFNEIEPRSILKRGDILINLVGASIGRAAVYDLADGANINQAVALIRLVGEVEGIEPSFLLHYFNSPTAIGYMLSSRVVNAQPNISLTDAREFPIPLPPLAEQRRIVAKVDELMTLVDHLEAQKQVRDKLAEAFAKACVASFTGTTQLERPEKMKAPKTELVSLVTLGKKPKPDAKAPLAKLLGENKGTLPAKSLWQKSGLQIDDFYRHLKTEIAQGWIAPPAEAEMKILEEA